MVDQRADLTFKYNLKAGRHGWLRLTPAYSIKLVEKILEQHPDMYLSDGRAAGELDWQAIGGTWGIATSRLQTWQPDGVKIPYPEFPALIAAIEQQSLVLANYVHRYFADMAQHVQSVYETLAPGGKAFYIVGNSRFYETLVSVEEIYAAMLEAVGFERVEVQRIRKRNSKKELFEFQVMGEKPV